MPLPGPDPSPPPRTHPPSPARVDAPPSAAPAQVGLAMINCPGRDLNRGPSDCADQIRPEALWPRKAPHALLRRGGAPNAQHRTNRPTHQPTPSDHPTHTPTPLGPPSTRPG